MDNSTFIAIWCYLGAICALTVTALAYRNRRSFQYRFRVSAREMALIVATIPIATVFAWPVLGFLSLRNSRA